MGLRIAIILSCFGVLLSFRHVATAHAVSHTMVRAFPYSSTSYDAEAQTIPARPTAQPMPPVTATAQPTAPTVATVQPTPQATVAVQPAAPVTTTIQPTAPATVPMQSTSPVTSTVQQAAEEVSPEFLHRVTSRVIGEGSFAIPQIACTVRNRWRASQGAGLDAVLKAYYARDVPPKPWQIEIVRKVFAGEIPCPETWWYALSLQDTSYWTPHDRVALVIVRDERSQVWIYER